MQRRARAALGGALVLAGTSLGVLAFLSATRDRHAPPPRPIARAPRSVLLLTLDTTRPDRLQPYGSPDVATPALQRLADEGVVFERACAVAPLTLVAHTSLLTGLYPPRHGVRNNGIHYVAAEVETLAEMLRRSGWRTGAFVSAAVLEKRYGLTQGFEVYDDDLSAGRERHPRVVPDRPADAVVDAALAWLAGLPAGERTFTWVHFYDPHAVYSPPPPFRDTYRDRLYDGEIAFMDEQIGRLLHAVRAFERDDLIVAAVGDHGESLGEHGEQTHGILAYESTMRVPWIMRVPDGPRGLRVAAAVSQVDLVPTLVDLLDQEVALDVDGVSLVPLLEGRERAADERVIYGESYLPFYTYGWAKLKVAQQGEWKYIDSPSPELFDVVRDPRELTDLSGDRPNVDHDLRTALGRTLGELGDAERETALAIDQEAAEKLRNLGYLAMGGRPVASGERRPDPKAVIDLHVALERARHLASNRLWERAAELIEGVLRRDPGNLAALVELAMVRDAAGESESARQLVERALGLDPASSRLRLMLANLELARGDTGRALAVLDAVIEQDPRFLEATVRKAAVLARLGRRAEAAELLAGALETDGDDPQVNLAYAQLVELPDGRLVEAEARLRAVLEREPFAAAGWRLLGELLGASGRPDEALQAYLDGLHRQPDDAQLHGGCGLLLARRGDTAAATGHLMEAIRLASGLRTEWHVTLGALLAEQGRFSEARRQYDLVLAADPDHAAARNNRAIALYRSGQLSEAEAELRELVRQHPRYADAFNNLAAVALDRRDWREAEASARRATELAPATAEAWNNLGLALDELGRLDEARRAFDRALAIEGSYWQARMNLGITLRKLGQPVAAATALEAALERAPGVAEIHFELGHLYLGPLADARRARAHLNAFLARAPRDPRAADVRLRIAALPPA